ncbi:MAG: hypothetical protein L6R41_001665 [Letrouitia leprolyta]|nr:MAG: hypothetical protein L6R41_001665 [Letrouitia leprolyta]
MNSPAKKPRSRSKKKIFPFLNLPAEIRIQIYYEALTHEYILIRKSKARKAANLLFVNRLIHSEAFQIFYDVNVFQVHIGGLPSDTEAQLVNVPYMRQCCLHLKITPKDSSSRLDKLVDKFVEEIWSGNMECLLCDIWEPDSRPGGTSTLEKLAWVKGIRLVQIVINRTKELRKKGKMGKNVVEVRTFQDKWCQHLGRKMMSMKGGSGVCESVRLGEVYEAIPALGINLVGDELQRAKEEGGWVVKENDLYVLFGKC